MEKYEVKILSYIKNFRKVLFICPLCRENNSAVLESEDTRELDYRCDGCRRKYTVSLTSLGAIIASMRQ